MFDQLCQWNNLSTLLIFVIVLWLLFKWFNQPANLPPGPFKWPIFGNLISLARSESINAFFKQQQQTYGDIFSLKLGPHYAVILCSYDLVSEAFVKKGEYFSDRPRFLYVPKVVSLHGRGIIFSNGERHTETRKFVLTTLRDFGVGKKSIEERIFEEASSIIDLIQQAKGSPVDIKVVMQKATSNIICSIIFGKRFDYDDEEFTKILYLIRQLFQLPVLQSPENFMEWLRFLPFNLVSKQVIAYNERFFDLLRQVANEHEKNFDPDNIRDFTDLYLKYKRESSNKEVFEEQNIFRAIVDLFIAGTDTTATTLTWCIIFMLNYPEVQKKVFEEIDAVIGRDRFPSYQMDREKLPQTEATFNEIMRFTSVVPTSIPRATVSDVNIGPYTIPKDCIVFPYLRHIHHSETNFADALTFNPQRFIENGKFKRPEHLIPFSLGRRMCIGEQLARMEVFCFFAALIQKFEFRLPEGDSMPPTDGKKALTNYAPHFRVIAVPR